MSAPLTSVWQGIVPIGDDPQDILALNPRVTDSLRRSESAIAGPRGGSESYDSTEGAASYSRRSLDSLRHCHPASTD